MKTIILVAMGVLSPVFMQAMIVRTGIRYTPLKNGKKYEAKRAYHATVCPANEQASGGWLSRIKEAAATARRQLYGLSEEEKIQLEQETQKRHEEYNRKWRQSHYKRMEEKKDREEKMHAYNSDIDAFYDKMSEYEKHPWHKRDSSGVTFAGVTLSDLEVYEEKLSNLTENDLLDMLGKKSKKLRELEKRFPRMPEDPDNHAIMRKFEKIKDFLDSRRWKIEQIRTRIYNQREWIRTQLEAMRRGKR